MIFTFIACGNTADNSQKVENENSIMSGEGSESTKDADSQNVSDIKTESNQTANSFKGNPVSAKRKNLSFDERDNLYNAISEKPGSFKTSEKFANYLTNNLKIPNSGVEFFNIGDNTYLMQIMVDPGNYLQTYEYGIYTEKNDKEAFVSPAKFKYLTKYESSPTFEMVSGMTIAPKFDEKTKTFEAFAHARGTGGCGTYHKYKFENLQPELVEVRAKKECDSTNTPVKNWDKIDFDKYPVRKDYGDTYSRDLETVNKWLKEKPELKMTNASEYKNLSYFREAEKDVKANPYYVTGDFNKDGKRDFAVALSYKDGRIDKRTNKILRAFAIFNDAESQNAKPAYYFDKMDGRFILIFKNNSLMIGSYQSDDGVIAVPKGNSYELKSMVDF